MASGTSRQLEALRAEISPEIAAIAEYPRLDPARVLRIYKKFGISSVEALRQRLESGDIGAQMGGRMEHHVRQALTESHEILLYDAQEAAAAVQQFLDLKVRGRAGAGDGRRSTPHRGYSGDRIRR